MCTALARARRTRAFLPRSPVSTPPRTWVPCSYHYKAIHYPATLAASRRVSSAPERFPRGAANGFRVTERAVELPPPPHEVMTDSAAASVASVVSGRRAEKKARPPGDRDMRLRGETGWSRRARLSPKLLAFGRSCTGSFGTAMLGRALDEPCGGRVSERLAGRAVAGTTSEGRSGGAATGAGGASCLRRATNSENATGRGATNPPVNSPLALVPPCTLHASEGALTELLELVDVLVSGELVAEEGAEAAAALDAALDAPSRATPHKRLGPGARE